MHLTKSKGDLEITQKIAYQLALCYKIGFGIERNEATSEEIINEFKCHDVQLSQLQGKPTKSLTGDSTWLELGHLPDENIYDEKGTEEAITQLSHEARDLSLVLGDTHILTLIVRNRLVCLWGNRGQENEVEKLSEQIIATCLKSFGPRSHHTLTSMCNLATVYAHSGRLNEAEKLMIQVVAALGRFEIPNLSDSERPGFRDFLFENLQRESDPLLVESMIYLADIYRVQERWQEAENLQLKAFKIATSGFGVDHPLTLRSVIEIGVTYFSLKQWHKAEEMYLEGLKLISGVLTPLHPLRLNAEAGLALIYSHQARHEEAEHLGMRVLNARLENLGLEHKDTLESMGYMTTIFRRNKQWGSAEDMCVKLIKTRRQIFSTEHKLTLEAENQLLKIYTEQELWSEAETLALQIVNVTQKVLGDENIATADATSNLAEIYTKQNRWEEAEDLHLRIIAIRKSISGIDHHNTLACMSALVVLYISWGKEKLAEAEQLAAEVMEKSVKAFGPKYPDSLTSMENLATVYQNQGHLDKAMSLRNSMEDQKCEVNNTDKWLPNMVRNLDQKDGKTASMPEQSSRIPFGKASTVEQVRRTINSSRRIQKGLGLKPL